jgi:hypothetical protein
MDNLDTTEADKIADEVAQLARAAAVVVERICRAARDPAAAQAARLYLGAMLLGQAVTSAAADSGYATMPPPSGLPETPPSEAPP